jgi:hypothetical protein
MLVCNVSLRAPRRAIVAELAEIAAADDVAAFGSSVFAALVDDPASAADIVDAYLGVIMIEAASAVDVADADFNPILIESATAADAQDTAAIYGITIAESVAAADVPDAVAISSLTTWNPSDKSANILLSNSNLTVGTNSGVDGAVRSTLSKAAGKGYFEFTGSGFIGVDSSVGIATGAASLSNIGPTSTGGALVYASGAIWFNGSSMGINIGGLGSGTICIAIDITGGLFWARNGSGNWNNSGTANPATGVGGINVSALFPTNAVFAVVTCQFNQDPLATANFGASAFAQSIPSGFTAWNSL